MDAPQVAIMASGEGTTAEVFIRAAAKKLIKTRTKLVICNNPKAGIFARVARLNKELGLSIKCVLIGRSNYPPKDSEKLKAGDQTEAEESALLDILSNGNFDGICLMGYMKKVGPRLVNKFGDLPDHTSIYQASMINTHPGLLPETKGFWGRHVQEFVLAHHLPFSGQTLHTVSADYDAGKTIAEHKVAVLEDDTVGNLFARVQAAEKKYLPVDVDMFLEKRRQYLKEKGG